MANVPLTGSYLTNGSQVKLTKRADLTPSKSSSPAPSPTGQASSFKKRLEEALEAFLDMSLDMMLSVSGYMHLLAQFILQNGRSSGPIGPGTSFEDFSARSGGQVFRPSPEVCEERLWRTPSANFGFILVFHVRLFYWAKRILRSTSAWMRSTAFGCVYVSSTCVCLCTYRCV